MNRDDEISLYGKRAARTIARFRMEDPAERAKADEKVQQWTRWAYAYSHRYLKLNAKLMHAIRLAGFTPTDVRQAALEGMTRASRVHEDDFGAFSAYSVWYMRKEIQRLARRRSVKANVPIFTDPPRVEESPLQALILKEQLQSLAAWLDKLPPLYRDIVTDHFGGVVQDDTAERVGLSKPTIRRYRIQALEWLRYFAGVGPKPERELPEMRYRGTGKVDSYGGEKRGENPVRQDGIAGP